MPDILYPTGDGLNQNENILIEYDGILFPTCLRYFYGLENCPLLEVYPFPIYNKLIQSKLTPKEIYLELAFYHSIDNLFMYLNGGESIVKNDLQFIDEYTQVNWNYREAFQLDINIAISKLLTVSYVKSVAVVFSHYPNDKDIFFLQDTLNPKDDKLIANKIKLVIPDSENTLVTDTILNEMELDNSQEVGYTSIITNEIDVIKLGLSDYKKYGCDASFFLLRNHDQNTSIYQDKDGKLIYTEDGTDEIINMINPKEDRLIKELPLPLRAKFARFISKPIGNSNETIGE